MELYPMIAPFVNYTKGQFNLLATESKEIAVGLTNTVSKHARRMLNNDPDAGGNGGVDDPDAGGDADPDAEGEDVPCTGSDCPAKNADGADGAVVTDDSGEKFQTGYPSPFLTNEQVQNGGFMVYLFGK